MIIENEQSKMTKQDLTKAFFRSQLLMATSNFERMQALGAYYSIVPNFEKNIWG